VGLDPGERQRRREVKLTPSHYTGSPGGHLAEEIQDFVISWLEAHTEAQYSRALADSIGRGLPLREAARVWGVNHRRLSEYRARLAADLKEML